MATDTTGKPIRCKAAVLEQFGEQFLVEEVEVAPPKEEEVRIKILATGLCHSDLFALNGGYANFSCPIILGHEAVGLVESVGPGVEGLAPGDTVIPCMLPNCRKCRLCKSTRTNLCEKCPVVMRGLLDDGTTRVTWRDNQVTVMAGIGTFAEYIVANQFSVAKIEPVQVPAEACLLGCAVPTGYGSVVRAANVREGSTVGIWGLGGVGLAAVLGCRERRAARVIGVDVNPNKFPVAQRLGCTDFVNPTQVEGSLSQHLIAITEGGLDYAIVAVGNLECMEAALASLHPGWGKLVVVGLTPPGSFLPVPLYELILGKTVLGCDMGGWKMRDGVPCLVDLYLSGKLPLAEFVSHTIPLHEINKGMELLKNGKVIRCVVVM